MNERNEMKNAHPTNKQVYIYIPNLQRNDNIVWANTRNHENRKGPEPGTGTTEYVCMKSRSNYDREDIIGCALSWPTWPKMKT